MISLTFLSAVAGGDLFDGFGFSGFVLLSMSIIEYYLVVIL